MSSRFNSIRCLDSSLPSKSYLCLVHGFSRRRSAILTQLRLGHLPLNQYLFRIWKAESPSCPYCQGITVESVCHYLLECPQYRYKRFLHLTRPLKRKAESLPFLLAAPEALTHLFRYIEATKRFKSGDTLPGKCLNRPGWTPS